MEFRRIKVLTCLGAAFVLHACDPDLDPAHLPPISFIEITGIIPEVRDTINLNEDYGEGGAGVPVSLILRNLPDLRAATELGPATRATLYDCSTYNSSTPCTPFDGATAAYERGAIQYDSTNYAYDVDGTWLAATAVGGGSYPRPGAQSFWHLLPHASPPSLFNIFPTPEGGETVGIAHNITAVRLYSTRYSSDSLADRIPTATAATDPEISLEDLVTSLLEAWQNPWGKDSWQDEPRIALLDTLAEVKADSSSASPTYTENAVHIVYFSPAHFPLEVLPGLTCTGTSPTLQNCIGAAFGLTGTDYDNLQYSAPGSSSSAAYSLTWLSDTYTALTSGDALNAIIVVPAGDNGGPISADNNYFPDLTDTEITNDFDGQGGWAGPQDFKGTGNYSDLIGKLNEVFFNNGIQAPTNIYAWAAALAQNSTLLPVVAVGQLNADADGLDNRYEISPYSSHCGEALQTYCIAAPGVYFSVARGGSATAIPCNIFDTICAPNIDNRVIDDSGECSPTSSGIFSTFRPCAPKTYHPAALGPRVMYTFGDESYYRGSGDQPFWVQDEDDEVPSIVPVSPISATEVAASIVTGALALIAQHYAGEATVMSAADILNRVRETASTELIADYDATIYGVGIIDISAAITPQGSASVPLAGGASSPLSGASLGLGTSLFGDSIAQAFADQHLVALDDLDSPFVYSMDPLLQNHSDNRWLQTSAITKELSNRLADGTTLTARYRSNGGASFALQSDGLTFKWSTDSHPGLIDGRLNHVFLHSDSAFSAPWASENLTWQQAVAAVEISGHSQLSVSQYRATGVESTTNWQGEDKENRATSLSWQSYFGANRVGIRQIHSQNTGEVLGLESRGALGRIENGQVNASNIWGTHHISAGTRLIWSLWDIRARTDDLATGIFSGMERMTADSWAVALSTDGPLNNSSLTIRLEQPLRARSGALEFTVPTAHTAEREILFDRLVVNASPSGRELRAQADFSLLLSNKGGRLQLSAGQATEPGHIRGAKNLPYALVGLELPL